MIYVREIKTKPYLLPSGQNVGVRLPAPRMDSHYDDRVDDIARYKPRYSVGYGSLYE